MRDIDRSLCPADFDGDDWLLEIRPTRDELGRWAFEATFFWDERNRAEYFSGQSLGLTLNEAVLGAVKDASEEGNSDD